MSAAPDMFAYGGEDGDARILALLQEWRCVRDELDRPCHDEPAREKLWSLDSDIEDKIMATPATGAAGLAVKVLLYARFVEDTSWTPKNETLRCSDAIHTPLANICRDIATFVPELTEIVAPVAHEDAVLINADIDLIWVNHVLSHSDQGYKPSPQWFAWVDEVAQKARDQIKSTPALTPRGEEIKARHA